MKNKEGLKLVIVGHVDHGKSTLIGRLMFDTDSLPPDKMSMMESASREVGRELEFAFLMDHFQEEREQGITIDTSQIFFKTNSREYVIIDAPGHVEFIKNMITGASQAEAAILIVDASEGVQEQTRRHSCILQMLGLKQVVVVVNKMDLIDYSQDKYEGIKRDMSEFLNSIRITPQYYIPISAIKGDNIASKSVNMKWYGGPTVLNSLDYLENFASPMDKGSTFPVQDVYKVGDKRIIVGRVEAGILRVGQEIVVLPTKSKTKILSIEKLMENKEEATAGECIGITTEDPLFVDRGHIVCKSGKEPILTDFIKASVIWLGKRCYRKGDKLVLKLATQEVISKIENISRKINSSTLEVIKDEADVIENLEVCEVTIKTKRPIVINNFNNIPELGRFVFVRDQDICAGGIIV